MPKSMYGTRNHGSVSPSTDEGRLNYAKTDPESRACQSIKGQSGERRPNTISNLKKTPRD